MSPARLLPIEERLALYKGADQRIKDYKGTDQRAKDQANIPGLIRTLEDILESLPEERSAWRVLMSVYGQTGTREEVLSVVTRLKNLLPDNSDALAFIGRELLKQDNMTAQAVVELEAAHKLSPNDSQITVALTRAYLQNKEPKKAKAVSQPLHEIDEKDLSVSAAFIQACRETGDIDGAVNAAQRAISHFPRDPGAHLRLIDIHREDRPVKAIRAARNAKYAIPNDLSLRVTLIELCLDNDREAEAYREALRVGEHFPEDTKPTPKQAAILAAALNYKPQNG